MFNFKQCWKTRRNINYENYTEYLIDGNQAAGENEAQNGPQREMQQKRVPQTQSK